MNTLPRSNHSYFQVEQLIAFNFFAIADHSCQLIPAVFQGKIALKLAAKRCAVTIMRIIININISNLTAYRFTDYRFFNKLVGTWRLKQRFKPGFTFSKLWVFFFRQGRVSLLVLGNLQNENACEYDRDERYCKIFHGVPQMSLDGHPLTLAIGGQFDD